MRRVMPFRAFGLVMTLATLPSCGGSEPHVVSAVAGLPEYTPAEAALYGDDFSASVFGLPKEVEPAQDPKLGERVQRAEAIVPVRFSTVSAESLAGVRGYTLSVTVDGPVVTGTVPPGPLDIRIQPGNASLTQVKILDTGLVGKKFLLFVRRYSDGGEAVNHYHGEADTPDVRKAIESSQALDSLRDRPQNPPRR
jgi:hypothetical protein